MSCLSLNNVGEYDNVSLTCSRTDSETLSHLPDIVWRLEGAVFERGIFLQYELARLVAESGISYLICGECADQVMNMRYLDKGALEMSGSKKVTNKEFPYYYGNNMVLKKNGVMANSFGIDCRYPYLDDEFISIAKALRLRNGFNKQFHVDNCRRVLPRGIVENIAKKGGATDCHSLFNSSAEISEFKSMVWKSVVRKIVPDLSRASFISGRLRRIIKIARARTSEDKYKLKEADLREWMCYLYLYLFGELFLSGKYDNIFDSQGISKVLTDYFRSDTI